MKRKQWIVFLQLFASFSNLLLILLSILIIVRVKDGGNSAGGALNSLEKNLPETHLHESNDYNSPPNLKTVSNSKASSISDTSLTYENNSLRNDSQADMMSSFSQDSSLKYADYVHKDSGSGEKKMIKTNSINGGRRKLKIAVPIKSTFKQFVEVSEDGKRITGFSIDVFQAVNELLPHRVFYEMVPFNGSYDDLLKAVAFMTFDAAVGDIMIRAKGYQLVEFSQPYMEAGLSMVVKTRVDKSQPWLCFSLFTPGMWFAIVTMSLFTGFVIWFIEHQNHEQQSGSPARPIGTVLWVSFATLYSGLRETPNNSLSHFVLAPWLFLMLVVSTTFTSTLTSIMTSSNLAPYPAPDVNELRRTNALVASDGSLFINQFLVNVLGFKPKNIRSMASSNEYARGLSTGDIKAAFLLTPYAKAFLAKNCKSFAITGPTYKLGSFGFVLPKGSAMATDMSQAIIRLGETGELQLMEDQMLSSFNCSASTSDDKVTQSLGPAPFSGLFIISGGASAIALLITLVRVLRRHQDILIQSGLMGGRLWSWLLIYYTIMRERIEPQSANSSST